MASFFPITFPKILDSFCNSLNIDEKRLPHSIDSHPPLKFRLEVLHCSVFNIADYALNITKESSAINLINNFEKVEEELTEVEIYLILKSLYDFQQLTTHIESGLCQT